MSGKVLVGGTAYAVKTGKVLVGGTAYTIKKGRTLIGGTGYDINLESKFSFNISTTGNFGTSFSITLSDGTTDSFYSTGIAQAKHYELKEGERVTLKMLSTQRGYTVNFVGNNVAFPWESSSFSFTVTKDCYLQVSSVPETKTDYFYLTS